MPAERRKLRLYGVVVDTDVVLRPRLEPATETARLRFRRTEPTAAPAPSAAPLFESPRTLASGESHLSLRSSASGEFVLGMPGAADFEVGDGQITARAEPTVDPRLVEIGFLGIAMAFWLERQGLPALHASAVEVDGEAVAFLAGNRGGKTSLAATFVAAGHRLLSDDILALEIEPRAVRARPSYPAMRLWPDAARRFCERPERLERVHPEMEKLWLPIGDEGLGHFQRRPLPLRAIYLPERAAPDEQAVVRCEALPRSRAVVEMVRSSFAAPLVEAVGPHEPRLDRLAQLARRVSLRRLVYPSGWERLAAVRAELLRDLETAGV